MSEITVGPLKITRLTLALYPRGDIDQFISHAQSVYLDYRNHIAELPYLHGDRYRENVGLITEERSYGRLQIGPLLENNAPCRLDIRPAVAGIDGMKIVRDLLMDLFGVSYAKNMSASLAVHLNVAFTIFDATLDNLIIHDKHVRRSALFYDERGALNELAIGAQSSNRQLSFSTAKPVKDESSSERSIRVKARLRLSQLTPTDLCSISNPFSGLSIVSNLSSAGPGSLMWRFFVEAAKQRGAVAALAMMDDDRRRRIFRLRLHERLCASWWDPKALWGEFERTLRQLQIFPPACFDAAPSSALSG